jgi:hypothetical protein
MGKLVSRRKLAARSVLAARAQHAVVENEGKGLGPGGAMIGLHSYDNVITPEGTHRPAMPIRHRPVPPVPVVGSKEEVGYRIREDGVEELLMAHGRWVSLPSYPPVNEHIWRAQPNVMINGCFMTVETVNSIVNMIEAGSSRNMAVQAAGLTSGAISLHTLMTQVANGNRPIAEQPFWEWFTVMLSMADARTAMLSEAVMARSSDWKAHAARLRALQPRTWAPESQSVQVSTTITGGPDPSSDNVAVKLLQRLNAGGGVSAKDILREVYPETRRLDRVTVTAGPPIATLPAEDDAEDAEIQ